MRTILVAGVLSLAVLAGPEPARADRGADLLKKAEAAAKGGKVLEAAGLYGDAVALAQKDEDPVAEGEAADALAAFLFRLRDPEPAPPDADNVSAVKPPPGRRDALAAVMARLDPARRGLFVSAPLLAGELLSAATAWGDGGHVAEAAAVLARHQGRKDAGGFIGALTLYATGLKALAAGTPEKAEAPLSRAVDQMVEAGWAEVVPYPATELAALRLAAGSPAKAAGALGEAAPLVAARGDPGLARRWRSLVEVRLAGAPEEALAPYRKVVDALLAEEAGGGASGAGGAGGAGMSGNDVPPIGTALRKTPPGKPILLVTREKDAYSIRVSWDPRFRATRKYEDAVRHWSEGGMVLAFHGPAVTAMMIDPVGNRGAPGESSSPGPGRAWYRLRVGESWSFSREGEVTISR